MQFLLGSLSTVGFFVCLAGAYVLGHRTKKPQAKHTPEDEEHKRKAKAVQDHFVGLMNYDVEKATRKEVI